MREGDWRTATKAFYVLHRFSANGAPEQAPNFQMRCVHSWHTHTLHPFTHTHSLNIIFKKIKHHHINRLSEALRQTDSRSRLHYFSLKGVADQGRPLVHRYGAYVLYRCQHFGPGFPEIPRFLLTPDTVEGAAAATGQASAAAAAEGRVVGNGGVLTGRDHEAFFGRVQELVERAVGVKLGPDDDVTEVRCVHARSYIQNRPYNTHIHTPLPATKHGS